MSKHKRCITAARDAEVEYRFSEPVSHQRAAVEFLKAKERGLPSGSVIDI